MSTGAAAPTPRFNPGGEGGGDEGGCWTSAILTSCKAIQHPEEETARHLPSPGGLLANGPLDVPQDAPDMRHSGTAMFSHCLNEIPQGIHLEEQNYGCV